MKRDEHHIVPNLERGGWDIKRENSQRASGHFNTKQQAINVGRIMSINQKTELIIHNLDGKISEMDSHGNDPCPPRG